MIEEENSNPFDAAEEMTASAQKRRKSQSFKGVRNNDLRNKGLDDGDHSKTQSFLIPAADQISGSNNTA